MSGEAGWIAHLVDPHIGGCSPLDAEKDRQLRELEGLSALQFPGPRWAVILDDLHRELVARDSEYRLLQVKEKFGALRVYAEFTAEARAECARLVRAAEEQSARTCERCGQPGTARSGRRWILTLCDECDAGEPEARPPPTGW